MLAIIIPFYKLTFLESTLQSLADQTDKRFKVYIGDDASPEDCISLLQKFEGQFEFVYHRFESNLGGISLTQQWERCVALSENEEWIMILGDDDILGENLVGEFYKNYNSLENYNVLRFAVLKINEKGEPLSSLYTNSVIESSKNILLNNKRCSLSEYVFKKEKLLKTGFRDFPLAWWSDVLAVLEFSNFGDIYSINEASAFVRISEISISGNQSNEVEKEKATYLFYYYLLKYKFRYFSSSEIDFLLEKVSKRFLNNRKNLGMFYEISTLYLRKGEFFKFLQFLNKIINSIFY
jgi:glycosyltransferase involved in cell wall biosynthesis